MKSIISHFGLVSFCLFDLATINLSIVNFVDVVFGDTDLVGRKRKKDREKVCASRKTWINYIM